MIISNIILAILALLVIVGLARPALKDFNVHPAWAIGYFLLVIGLSFIPNVVSHNAAFTMNVGALLFFLVPLGFFLFKGKWSSKGIAFLVTLVITGIIYAVTRIFSTFTAGYMTGLNVVYAIAAGALAFVFTRNGKYSYISAVTSMLFTGWLLQIGHTGFSLTYMWEHAVIAGATALVLHGILALATSRPGRYSYYYEVGKLKD